MTNEEKDLLIAYLVDAGELDQDRDVESQFLGWYRVREDQVSGKTHYKTLPQAARVRARSFEEGSPAGPGRGHCPAGLRPVGDQPGPSPLYGPCPPEGELTPGPRLRINAVAPGGADPPG